MRFNEVRYLVDSEQLVEDPFRLDQNYGPLSADSLKNPVYSTLDGIVATSFWVRFSRSSHLLQHLVRGKRDIRLHTPSRNGFRSDSDNESDEFDD